MNFDIAIIGGGPAGYTAAERAGANGLRAVLFEKKAIGGVCLNERCIPTKTLLYSAKILDSIKSASKYGISAESPSFDLIKIMSRKEKTVKMLTGGVKMTVNSYGVTIVEKEAFIEGEENGLIRIICEGERYEVKYLLVPVQTRLFLRYRDCRKLVTGRQKRLWRSKNFLKRWLL